MGRPAGGRVKLAQVYPRLYQAGAKNWEKVPKPELVRVLLAHQVGFVLNVNSGKKDDPDKGYDKALAMSLPDKITYAHVPFGDNSQFEEHMPVLMQMVTLAVEKWHFEKKAILTHCAYGVNRSGLANALIIREIENCTGAEALAILRQLRKGACGGNEHFVTYLEGLPKP